MFQLSLMEMIGDATWCAGGGQYAHSPIDLSGHHTVGVEFRAQTAHLGIRRVNDLSAASQGRSPDLFNEPNKPETLEFENFAGPVLHTARWQHEHDLTGRRVAVVGTGSSVVQTSVALAPRVAHLTLFQRTAGWIVPKGDRDFDPSEREALARPVVYRWRRWRLFVGEQFKYLGGRVMRADTRPNRKGREAAQSYIDEVLGDHPELREMVTPRHPFLGKRPVQATGFYETLLRENVTLVPWYLAA